jgi:hypothetical protein
MLADPSPEPSPLAPLPTPPFPPHRERGKKNPPSAVVPLSSVFVLSPSSPGEGGWVGSGEEGRGGEGP